ncbi:SNARE domain protein [Mycena venus]|uniref:SNARE domain protein n=1 Tax=Mycena venus TaxID=2733690 RepID=A0A8H6XTF2_9AGAR|nr:SNARE domain protein [Mycena venus]
MSFQDIEAGLSPRSFSPQSREEAAFLELQSSLSLQVFKINSNVQGIRKLVEQLGTVKDSAALRKSLHDLTDTTREMVKRGSDDLKKLAVLQMGLPSQKTAMQKTSNDLEASLVEFQRAQQVSVERQRIVVQGVRMAVDDSSEHVYEDTPVQRQAQILQQQLSPHELAYQESLIQEREQEIREIETGIHELAEIFQDLGTLVHQQGGMLDNIESNISSVAADVSSGADELRTASEYQRRAGRRAACLMIVLVIVTAVVLLAVSGPRLFVPALLTAARRFYHEMSRFL